MNALILFSHGSLLCGAGEALDAHAARLRETGTWDMVAVGYMNYSEPTFADSVAECAARGVTRILVLPFFLVPGYFVTKSLPQHLDTARAAHPELEFIVAQAIGFDPGLADALIASAQSPLGPEEWRDDLTAAARGCRARPDCPLYGTLNCPRAPAPDTPARPFVE